MSYLQEMFQNGKDLELYCLIIHHELKGCPGPPDLPKILDLLLNKCIKIEMTQKYTVVAGRAGVKHH